MNILLIILGIHLLEVLILVVVLLYRRNSKLEKAIQIYQDQNNSLSYLIGEFTKSLEDIDEKVYVDADDSIRTVFEKLKLLQDSIESL